MVEKFTGNYAGNVLGGFMDLEQLEQFLAQKDVEPYYILYLSAAKEIRRLFETQKRCPESIMREVIERIGTANERKASLHDIILKKMDCTESSRGFNCGRCKGDCAKILFAFLVGQHVESEAA